MVEHTYKFDSVYEQPEEYAPYLIGRLLTSKGEIIRIFFDKEGLKLYIPEECKSNGDIMFLKTMPEVMGLAKRDKD